MISFKGKLLTEEGLRPYPAQGPDGLPGPDGRLNPRQTIYEIVAEGLRIHRIDRGAKGETEEGLVAKALSRAGFDRPSASTCATRTSSRVASVSAW